HDNPQLSSKTLFATHYHELLGLEHKLSRVKNYNVSVSDTGESLVFTHNIIPGGANRSYGVHVAQLAGLPKQIIENAYDLLINLEHSTHSPKLPEKDLPQENNNTDKEKDKIKIIDKLDLDSISPLEALQILYKLKQD
ncbi:MAG TPA: DNA mismatch repair protein MutS, partial [Chloroflexi bacterium]|nr:DNA mismatch repair protein MutS [Chloroflexota bacterium]